MTNKLIRSTLILAAGMLAAAGAYAQDPVTWKVQTLWQAGNINQQTFEAFAENVKVASGGRLIIEALPVGAIVSANEAADAVRDGLLDGQHSNEGYLAGKEPAFSMLVDMNMAYESPEQHLMWFKYGGGAELAQELLDKWNQHYLGPVSWGPESIPSKMPLRSVTDFQGVKMRAPEGMGASIWREVGVGVSTLPGTEVYTALERGKIEATDWGSLAMNDDLGYDKIAEYAIYPGIHSMPMACGLCVRKDRWDALPDDLKRIVELAVTQLREDMLLSNRLRDMEAAAKRNPETLVAWSSEARAELREVARKVWQDWGSKSEIAGKFYDSHIAWMTKIGLLK
jgi:TRAP-type mannitol/chloroaromatic compound transport system substrate-binding protein